MTHAEELEKQLAAQETEDLRAVLATPEGRRVLNGILGLTGIYGRSYTGEALSMAHLEGRREIGITLLEKIKAQAPGSYLAMLRESLEAETLIAERRREAAEKDQGESDV